MEKAIDEATGDIRTVRKLVGKLDEKGNVVPTSGRRGRLPKKQASGNSKDEDTREEMKRLREETEELQGTIAALERNQEEIIKGLEDLLVLANQQEHRKNTRKARR